MTTGTIQNRELRIEHGNDKGIMELGIEVKITWGQNNVYDIDVVRVKDFLEIVLEEVPRP